MIIAWSYIYRSAAAKAAFVCDAARVYFGAFSLAHKINRSIHLYCGKATLPVL